MPVEKTSYQAVVEKIVPGGRNGPYGVARTDPGPGQIPVPFSLDKPFWQEEEWPEPGMFVLLERVRKKRDGWRSNRVRFIQPSDEQPATSS